MESFGSPAGEDKCKRVCSCIDEGTWNLYKFQIVFVIGVLVTVVVGLGISDAVIYGQSKKFTPDGDDCPMFPANLTSYTLDKQLLKQWKWQYNFPEFQGFAQKRCPTVTGGDVDVYLHGDEINNLVVRSNQEVSSLVGRTYVYDCHGNVLYQVQAHNVFDAIINGLKISVSYQIMSADGTQTLGYVSGDYILIDDINVIDTYGTVVANIQRDILGIKWSFSAYNTSSIVSDPRILTKLAMYKSFSEDDSTDGCNSYFWGIAWLFLALGIALICWITFVSFKAMYPNKSCDVC